LFGCFQTATTRRKAVSTRRILALLVVLALSLGLCSIPAGSATLQRPSVNGDEVISDTTFKDGDGEDIDGGDDDRWGNTTINGGDNGDQGNAGGDEEDDDAFDSAQMFGRLGVLGIGVRALFGFLAIVL
jgi:hypothetical protein